MLKFKLKKSFKKHFAFLRGFGGALGFYEPIQLSEIFPDNPYYNEDVSPTLRDWQSVGDDMWKAIEEFEKEIKISEDSDK